MSMITFLFLTDLPLLCLLTWVVIKYYRPMGVPPQDQPQDEYYELSFITDPEVDRLLQPDEPLK